MKNLGTQPFDEALRPYHVQHTVFGGHYLRIQRASIPAAMNESHWTPATRGVP